MPRNKFQTELDAITAMYVKLTELPVGDLTSALKQTKVITDGQKKKMDAMKLDSEKATFLVDNVIIPCLKVDDRSVFDKFLKVLLDDDTIAVKTVGEQLRSLLGQSPQPNPPQPNPPQSYLSQPYPAQPHFSQTYPSQPYPSQPYPLLASPGNAGTPLLQVEKFLLKSSKIGTDPAPSNNRNFHAVCLIKSNDGTERGTGFIAKLKLPNSMETSTVLVTNHHVINSLATARKATYQFSYLRDDSDYTPGVIKGEDLIPQRTRFYTNKETDGQLVLLDYTLFEIYERPLINIKITSELDGEKFSLFDCRFDLDNPATPSDIGKMETVTIRHYPNAQPLKRSTQGSVSVGNLLFYACDTDPGSSGAPVFKVVSERLQVIALHRGSWEEFDVKFKFNFGTLITRVLSHVRNETIGYEYKGNITYQLSEKCREIGKQSS